MKDRITMIEIFSGIGSQTKALGQLPIPHEVVHTMDIEKDAILAYAAMRYDLEEEMKTFLFPSKQQMVYELQLKNVGYDFAKRKHTITMKMNENKVKLYYIADRLSRNLGDVSLQKELPYVDVVFHSSPCQAFSLAGKGEGGDEGSGTTSSLMWESLRLIETSNCEYVMWENVAAVLSDKHRHNFIKYLERLSEMGYESSFDLLNGKNYGVPQNRLRIFCISRKIKDINNYVKSASKECISINKQVIDTMKQIREQYPNINIWEDFIFPETIPLTTRLKDILEKNVDAKYYLPDERIEKILNSSFHKEHDRIQSNDICDALLARDWKGPKCVQVAEEPEVHQIMNIMPGTNRENPNQGRVYDKNGIAPTLTRMDGGNRQPFIIEYEPFCVASRGRNPENPSDRTKGIHLEQKLEPNFSGCTNTFTSVQKDNYICEPIIYDDYNSRISVDQDAINTLTCNCGVPTERNGVKIIEPVIVEDFYQSREPRVYTESAPTLRSERSGLKVGETEESIRWRIRKLIEKECWRLMGFTDEDHDRAAKYTSASARYKMAGNSIIVACLIALFSSIFLEDGYKAEVWTKYQLHFTDKK